MYKKLKKEKLGPYDEMGQLEIEILEDEDNAWGRIVSKYSKGNNSSKELREDVKKYNSIYSLRGFRNSKKYQISLVKIKSLGGKTADRLLLRKLYKNGSRIELYSKTI